jgi:hypothetical protein
MGTFMIAVGIAPVFFDIRPLAKRFIPIAVLGILVSILAYYEDSSSLVTAYIAVPAALTIIVAGLYLPRITAPIVTNKAVFIGVLSIIIFSLQPLIYPNFIGQALSIDALTTTGPMVSVFYETSWVGGALLAVMLIVYVWIAYRQKPIETNPATSPSERVPKVG